MGFCYPGRDSKGGDLPPRPECAPAWHPLLRPALGGIRLTLLVGSYAQAFYLGKRRLGTMTATVHGFRDYLPEFLPLPHPSWRTTRWERDNSWFGDDLLPELRSRLQALI
jgi:uracil-DNA glycosylase